MENIINTTILGLFFGTIGTTVGGIIGCTIKNTSNKFLSFILSFAAGLMMSVICFDLKTLTALLQIKDGQYKKGFQNFCKPFWVILFIFSALSTNVSCLPGFYLLFPVLISIQRWLQ